MMAERQSFFILCLMPTMAEIKLFFCPETANVGKSDKLVYNHRQEVRITIAACK